MTSKICNLFPVKTNYSLLIIKEEYKIIIKKYLEMLYAVLESINFFFFNIQLNEIK